MKTLEDFYNEAEGFATRMAEELKSKGYEAEAFTNIEGDATILITVDNNGEKAELVAVFERV